MTIAEEEVEAGAGENTTIGGVTWHTSEPDGRPDVGISVYLGHGHRLWCGEISSDLFADAGGKEFFDSDGGWFIVHYSPEPVLIAKCADRYDAQAFVEQIASWAALTAAAKVREQTVSKEPMMTEGQIKHMVDRFLGWKLPENFNPDGGVSFKKLGNEGTPHQYEHKPSGTNLFDVDQANAMVRYMLEGMPAATRVETEEALVLEMLDALRGAQLVVRLPLRRKAIMDVVVKAEAYLAAAKVRLAQAAIERLNVRANETPEEWAAKLAPDLALVGEAEYAATKVRESGGVGVPEGWRLVPEVVTEQWARKYGTSGNRYFPWGHAARDIEDMLASSPPPPSGWLPGLHKFSDVEIANEHYRRMMKALGDQSVGVSLPSGWGDKKMET